MSKTVEIYIATHKKADFPDDPGYIPMQVGKQNSLIDLGIKGDDTGDNISALNPFFCELTAQYWFWKNSKADVKGLVHYRRYLAPVKNSDELNGHKIAASNDFDELDNGFDIVIPRPSKFYNHMLALPINNRQQYASCVYDMDLILTRDIIGDYCSRYVKYWDHVMESCYCSICNIIIGKSEVVDEYSKWLFSILFELQKVIPFEDYIGQERRVFGFLAERLLNVWYIANRRDVRTSFRDMVFLP